jgi:hypothetical protein
MITLDSIEYQNASIQIKDAAGDALAIGADGSLNITDNGGSLTVDGTVELGATTLAALESITVVASDLDIRDLAFATDKVDASGSEVSLDAGTLAALESITVQNGAGASAVNIQDGGNSITVDGTVELGATTLAALESITVVASDLDIRDLTHVSDSVKVGDGTDFLAINADGSINAQFIEGGYASWSVVAATVNATESQLVSSPLTGRLRVEIQNLGNKDIWIRQATGVTTSNGLKIPKGSSYEQALDAGAQIWAIADGASADVRIAQYAA